MCKLLPDNGYCLQCLLDIAPQVGCCVHSDAIQLPAKSTFSVGWIRKEKADDE